MEGTEVQFIVGWAVSQRSPPCAAVEAAMAAKKKRERCIAVATEYLRIMRKGR